MSAGGRQALAEMEALLEADAPTEPEIELSDEEREKIGEVFGL